MRCTLIAVGLRGDVQPMIALGKGLAAAGVDVRCAVQSDFAETAAYHGLDVAPVRGRADAFFGSAAGGAARDRLRMPREFRRLFDNYFALSYEHTLIDIGEAARDADVVICWPWVRAAASLAEALRVPVAVAGVYPVMSLPTSAFPNPFQDPEQQPVTARDIRRTWRLALPALAAGQAALNRWRVNSLNLPAMTWRAELARTRRMPHLLGYSESVLPRPGDWPSSAHVTGFWFLDEADGYGAPDDLLRFLDAGPPPVAIGFSSQTSTEAERVTQTVLDAVTRAGVRAVVLTGFGGMKQIAWPPHVYAARTIPHDWLFPRVEAVVHHGGSGTTGAALRYGRPNMALPFGYDQRLWGSRLHALGVGPAPIDASAITADALASALHALTTDSTMKRRAAALADQLSREDGVAAAVSEVLALMGTAPAARHVQGPSPAITSHSDDEPPRSSFKKN